MVWLTLKACCFLVTTWGFGLELDAFEAPDQEAPAGAQAVAAALPAPVTRLQVVGYEEEACGPVTSPLAF